MKTTMKKSLSIALGSTFAAGMSTSPVANADANPFGMQNLESGYMQVAEGKCGEGKCGGDKMDKEGKCGEGKCGEGKMSKEGKMKMNKEGKCGEGKMDKEGKCGEGKMNKKGKMDKEGKCGEGKCGGDKK